MDAKNTFHTEATYKLERLDYAVALLLLSAWLLAHAGEVNWWRFAVAFAWIDVIGYIPGAVSYRRGSHPSGRIPTVFPILYNVTHSYATNALVVGGWYLATGQLEWAMLAGPIHLCGDRGLFGNIYKPLKLSYEPARHPLFARFTADFGGAQ